MTTATTADRLPMRLRRKIHVSCFPVNDQGHRASVMVNRSTGVGYGTPGYAVDHAETECATFAEALALAAWEAAHPDDYPPARECADVASVECLGCHVTVTDPTGIDVWNGYGSGPCRCDHEDTPTRWTTYDGTWQTILDGRVLDSGTADDRP